MEPGKSTEALLGEVLARLGAMEKRADTLGADVREARDTALEVVAVMREQRLGEQLEQLRSDIKTMATELRSDLVNAVSRLDAKLSERITENAAETAKVDGKVNDLARRVEALERMRERAAGMGALAGWLVRYAPWLLSGILAVLAFVGLKDKLPS